MATLYLAVYPSAAPVPTWNRTTGWSGTPVYTDADTSPESSGSYTFVPDSSGLTASTPYVWYAVWDDGTDTVGPVASGAFETLSAGVTAEGVLAALSLTAPESSPFVVVAQSGELGAISLTSPAGAATTVAEVAASGDIAQILLSPPAAASSPSVSASGALPAGSITAPTGSASSLSEAFASGDLVALTLSAPSGTAGVDVAGQGVMAGVSIAAPGAVEGEVSIPAKTLTARISALSFGARVGVSALSARIDA